MKTLLTMFVVMLCVAVVVPAQAQVNQAMLDEVLRDHGLTINIYVGGQPAQQGHHRVTNSCQPAQNYAPNFGVAPQGCGGQPMMTQGYQPQQGGTGYGGYQQPGMMIVGQPTWPAPQYGSGAVVIMPNQPNSRGWFRLVSPGYYTIDPYPPLPRGAQVLRPWVEGVSGVTLDINR